jgi:hypothetical protein
MERASDHLDDHWVQRWFGVPIAFVAPTIGATSLVVGESPTETAQVVGVSLAVSTAVVAAGLLAERLLTHVTGAQIFYHRDDLE